MSRNKKNFLVFIVEITVFPKVLSNGFLNLFYKSIENQFEYDYDEDYKHVETDFEEQFSVIFGQPKSIKIFDQKTLDIFHNKYKNDLKVVINTCINKSYQNIVFLEKFPYAKGYTLNQQNTLFALYSLIINVSEDANNKIRQFISAWETDTDEDY